MINTSVRCIFWTLLLIGIAAAVVYRGEIGAWISETDKAKLDKETEIFIGVRWFKYVDNPNDGYIDKGLTTVPLVAYTATDKSTYKKVRVHFGYTED